MKYSLLSKRFALSKGVKFSIYSAKKSERKDYPKKKNISTHKVTFRYRSKLFARPRETISDTMLGKGKGWGLFCSDWREGAVFSPLICGGSRSSAVGGECGGGKTPP
jgi:hypothetical protein